MKTVNLHKFSLWILVLLMLVMGLATFFEKRLGTPVTLRWFYHSYWFIGLWIFLVIITIYCFGVYKKPLHAITLHFSLVLILTGAFITHLISFGGSVILHEGEKVSAFVLKSDEEQQIMQPLPFTLQLDSCRIKNYPGTSTVTDYVGYLTFFKKSLLSQHITISMNHIGSFKGYHFCLSSFDEDRRGCTLSVSYDFWGTTISYTGYLTLAISMLFTLLSPKGQFRSLLKHPLLKRSLLLLLLGNGTISAQSTITHTNNGKTITSEMADNFGRTWVFYNNRITPLQTIASDFTVKLTGHRSYKNYSAEQILSGWLFFPSQWYNEPFIQINPNPGLQKILGIHSGYVSYSQFFNSMGRYKLEPWIDRIQTESTDPLIKAIADAHEKVNLIGMLHNGSLLRIYPVQTSQGIDWLVTGQNFPLGLNYTDSLFIKNTFAYFNHYVITNKADSANLILQMIAMYQFSKTQGALPSDIHKRIEILYNRLQPFDKLFMVALFLGTIALVWAVVLLYTQWSDKWLSLFLHIGLIVVFIIQTLALSVRTYISGHLPLSNGYEVMLCIAWAIMSIGLLFRYRSLFIQALALFLSGIVLLTAHLGMNNPQITPLVPVLNSYWLNLHVSCMMLAYSFAGFVSLIGAMILLIIIITPLDLYKTINLQIERLTLLSKILLYPCVFLMGLGIFLGAVWANISWGRYWGWDPKETWALITFLVYALLLHSKIYTRLSQPVIYNSLTFLSFSSVLMTFFGVSYFLGGLHSYASGKNSSDIIWLFIGVCIALMIVLIAGIKSKKQKQTI